MIVSISKTVGNVDFGISGKKTIDLELRLEQSKGKWSFFCYYAYIVLNDGKKVPVGQDMLSYEFLKEHIDKALEEIKLINDYELKVSVK